MTSHEMLNQVRIGNSTGPLAVVENGPHDPESHLSVVLLHPGCRRAAMPDGMAAMGRIKVGPLEHAELAFHVLETTRQATESRSPPDRA